jgi:energy-coupling factor transport system substrate-specific component
VLGAVCLLASGLLTAGVGPWLPFQMIGAAWVGLGAGALAGRLPTRAEIPLLAGYAVMAAVAYGWLLNLWFWPTATGLPEPLAFVPGAGFQENLQHWLTFNLTTSLGYDLPRAALTSLAVLLLGRRVLGSLRRASRRASFDAQARFDGGHHAAGPHAGPDSGPYSGHHAAGPHAGPHAGPDSGPHAEHHAGPRAASGESPSAG